MLKTIVNIVLYVQLIVVGVAIGWLLWHKSQKTVEIPTPVAVVADTITATDTVFVRYDSIFTATDTVFVPITLHHFDTIIDSVHIGGSYSGYNAVIDSIFVECPPCITIETQNKPVERSKFHLGVTIGGGVCSGGISPFFGLGLTYSIITL